jgi:Glycosyl transferases group 1
MRILLPFWRGIRENTFYQDFHQGVADALRELGHQPARFAFAERGQLPQEEAEHLYRDIEHARPDAVLDLACWGYGLSGVTLAMQNGKKEPIFNVFDVPYAGILLDQPCNQAINGIRARRLYATYPDLGHPEQVRLVFPELKLTGEIFAPPAIRPENDRSAAKWESERDIDVLYVGNMPSQALERFWHNRANAFWDESYDPEVCDAIADAALAEPERSFHLSVRAALAQLAKLPEGFDFHAQLRAVENFLRFSFRYDAVMAVARTGARMRIAGGGWEKFALPSTVELGPETGYDGFFRLAGKAKICLDASTYLDGANDRVFSYALNRAVCFTNAAGYLRGSVGDCMRYYSMRNLPELGEQIKMLLARPEILRETGERARQAVLSAHTWRHRTSEILKGMRLESKTGASILPPVPGR